MEETTLMYLNSMKIDARSHMHQVEAHLSSIMELLPYIRADSEQMRKCADAIIEFENYMWEESPLA